uniref:Phosphoserine phosphatase n=1 Tax=Pan troglodytes TaxID=9598 RepID=A0A2I3RV89_PANTR
MASASCSPCGALASPEPGRKILPRMISHSELRKLFYSADAVCFDVDSTVISEEGIGCFHWIWRKCDQATSQG